MRAAADNALHAQNRSIHWKRRCFVRLESETFKMHFVPHSNETQRFALRMEQSTLFYAAKDRQVSTCHLCAIP